MSHTVPPTEIEADTEVLDALWLAAPSRRSRFRIGLVLVLAVLMVFLGGVEVQKHWGAADPSLTAGSASLPSGRFNGFPAGSGFPSGSQTQSQNGTTTGSAAPALIGKLIHIDGHTWAVKDLGGKTHTVTVTGSTTVTRALSAATGRIRPGTSVTVQGTTHGDTVAATAVTIR